MATTARDHLSNEHGHESDLNEAEHKLRQRAANLKKRLGNRDTQVDILAAALIGAAVGVTATLLLRPQRPRRIFDAEQALNATRRGISSARKKGEALWESMPDGDEIGERFKEYAESARETIDRAVDGELRALRKRLRRERSRLHI
jgi:gas vesicle protein